MDLVRAGDNTAHPLAGQGSDASARLSADADMADFKNRAHKLVDRLSLGPTNIFGSADLVKLVEDPQIKGRDADVLATLYGLAANPAKVMDVDGKILPAPNVRSHAGIDALKLPTSKEVVTIDVLELAGTDAVFKAADSNHDGKLSKAEVNKSHNYKFLTEIMPELGKSLRTRPLEQGDFTFEAFSLSQDVLPGAAVMKFAEGSGLRRGFTVNNALYADESQPLKSISIEGVHQGLAGDCYFESVLAETAKLQPQTIRDAIQDNKNGTYTVTFKGDPEHPVTIPAPTDTELALYNGGSQGGTWAAVMEKAYASYAVTYLGRANPDLTPQDAVAGGKSSDVVSLLTGHEADYMDLSEYNDPAYSRIDKNGQEYNVHSGYVGSSVEWALENKRLVTLDVHDSPVSREAGLLSNHSYSVVSYHPGENGGYLTLRNPWGDDPGTAEGSSKVAETKVTIDYLLQMKTSIGIESQSPPQSLPVS